MGWWGSLRVFPKTSKNRGVKVKVVRRGEGGLKVSPPSSPPENLIIHLATDNTLGSIFCSEILDVFEEHYLNFKHYVKSRIGSYFHK